jgi:hypothetical protein
MLELTVAFETAIADFVGNARLEAHAATVERRAVEIRTTILGDGATEELVTFTGTLFAEAALGVVGCTKGAVAVFLATLVADVLTEARLHLSFDDADLAAVRALAMRLAGRAVILNASFVTTDLPLRAIGVVTASGLTRLAGAIDTALVEFAVATALAARRGTGVFNGAGIGGITTVVDRTGGGQ